MSVHSACLTNVYGPATVFGLYWPGPGNSLYTFAVSHRGGAGIGGGPDDGLLGAAGHSGGGPPSLLGLCHLEKAEESQVTLERTFSFFFFS
jgi:hypothetical protein